MFGPDPLGSAHLDWIKNLGSDPLQHYIGWQFYRNEPWTFPLGIVRSYGYPFGTALPYTDSIPLIAIPLKLFSPILPSEFQYLGPWILGSFVSQFIFGALIVREISKRLDHQILGGSLFLLSPAMIIKTFTHNSLVGHWIILAFFWLLLIGRRKTLSAWPWVLGTILAVSIHPYFVPMVLAIFGVALLENYEQDRKHLPRLVGQLVVVLSTVLVTSYTIGMFSVSADGLGGNSFGQVSMNLNTLFNSLGLSIIVPALPLKGFWQFEGYAYLGLGNLLLLLIAFVTMVRTGVSKEVIFKNKYLILACLGFTAFAVSQRVTFNDRVLFELDLPGFILTKLSIFRASGRFIWPAYYTIILFLIAWLVKKVKYHRLILLMIVVVQFIDLLPEYRFKAPQYTSPYQSPLQSSFWSEVPKSYNHLILLPAGDCNNTYHHFAIFAAQNSMTLNYGYFARADYQQIFAFADRELENIFSGSVSSDTIYIFCSLSAIEKLKASQINNSLIRLAEIDGFLLGIPEEKK